MYDIIKSVSTTILDMPTSINGLIIQINDWNYVFCNGRISFERIKNTYLHEIKHIDLKHLDNYNIESRDKFEKEVNDNKQERRKNG